MDNNNNSGSDKNHSERRSREDRRKQNMDVENDRRIDKDRRKV